MQIAPWLQEWALMEGPPLISDIAGITKLVFGELAKCKDWDPLLKTVEEHFKKDGRDNMTVENILTHERALPAASRRRQGADFPLKYWVSWMIRICISRI